MDTLVGKHMNQENDCLTSMSPFPDLLNWDLFNFWGAMLVLGRVILYTGNPGEVFNLEVSLLFSVAGGSKIF